MRVLVIDCGSATLEHKLFEDRNTGLELLFAPLFFFSSGYRAAVGKSWRPCPHVIAHREVHGGGRLPIWSGSMAGCSGILRGADPAGAQLHNGPALEGIEATLGAGVPLIAAPDSAFQVPSRAWPGGAPSPSSPACAVAEGTPDAAGTVTERDVARTGWPEPTNQ